MKPVAFRVPHDREVDCAEPVTTRLCHRDDGCRGNSSVDRIAAILQNAQPRLRSQRLRVLGYDAAGGTPADFAKVVSADAAKWAKLIKERKITID